MHDFSETIGKKVRLAQIWSLLAVGLLGLAVAIAAWTALSVWEERLARAKFNDTAGDYATVIQSGLDEYLDKIRALGAFFDASDAIDATEFGLFTDQILQGYGDTMRLLWCPRVGRDERASFERDARDAGMADYSITTWAPTGPVHGANPRDEYFPILYSTVSQSGRPLSARISARRRCGGEPLPGHATATPWRRPKKSSCETRSAGSVRASSCSCRSIRQASRTTRFPAAAEIWRA